jgi:nitrogenase molybdenum-iron protein alpha/beta subunit
VNYPWDDRVREPSKPYEQGLANLSDLDFVEEGMITTDLDENDVIFGNPSKLKKLLDHATSRPNPDGRLLFVSNTCVPTVIGDDVESVVKRVRSATGKQILYLTVSPRSMTNVFTDLLVDRRLRAEARAEAAPANTVATVSWHASPSS